ncbi:MAG: DUF1285 domain-containing protein [Hyphomicrobiales bacterium]
MDHLAAIAKALDLEQNARPTELWNPPFSGDLDIRIAGDGTWYYLGSAIGRRSLVKLFSSVLRRDPDGKFYLVTPVEKVGITVDDAPFVAVDMKLAGNGPDQVIGLRTNVDDAVVVDNEHPLRFAQDAANDALKPYVLVRGGLEAVVNRAVFYDLVDAGTTADVAGEPWYGVWSCGRFFAMCKAEELDF